MKLLLENWREYLNENMLEYNTFRVLNTANAFLDELGEGQEYQTFFTDSLSGAVQTSDLELVVGLDQSSNDSFVMPVKQPLEVFEDPALHRHQRAGFYGWAEVGFGVLDNRRILLGSF